MSLSRFVEVLTLEEAIKVKDYQAATRGRYMSTKIKLISDAIFMPQKGKSRHNSYFVTCTYTS